MKTIQVNIYQFDELTDTAKDVARDWYRKGLFDYDWWAFQYVDAKNIGLEINGFDIYRHTIEGKLLDSVNNVCKKIKEEHGKTCGTYKLAKTMDLRKANDSEETQAEFLHSLLQEYLSQLQQEAEYMESNESVDENIRANEYEFLDSGKQA